MHYVSQKYKYKLCVWALVCACVCVHVCECVGGWGTVRRLGWGSGLRSEVFGTECLMRVAVNVAACLWLQAPNSLFSHTLKNKSVEMHVSHY